MNVARRVKEGGFVGAEPILAQIPQKIGELKKRRVGLFVDVPARDGATIHDQNGKEIGMPLMSQICNISFYSRHVAGKVTSGTFSPILKKAIAMAYVKPPHNKLDGHVQVKVRDKLQGATITKMPFVPTKYKN